MARPAPTVTVKVHGLRTLARALEGMGDDLGDLRDLNVRVASLVWRETVARAPRDTGRLAASTRPRVTKYRAGVRSGLRYANPIHWGWPRRSIPARTYASDAAAATEPQWLGIYLDGLQVMCDRVGAAVYPGSP